MPGATVKAGVPFILVTMLLEYVVVGMVAPVIPELLVSFTHESIAQAAGILGGFTAMFAVAQLVMAPVLGVLADRYGRRPVILLSNAVSVVDLLILAFAPNLWWLFVGRVLTGGTAAVATTGAAYIADVVPPEGRPAAFGLAGATFGVGFAVGPAIGGLLAHYGLRTPFYVAAGLMLVNLVYGVLVLPESLPSEERSRTIAWRRANPLGALRLLRRNGDLAGLAASTFCSSLAVEAFSIFVLFTLQRFGWDATANGLGLSLFGAVSIVAAFAVGPLVSRFGGRAVTFAGYAFGIAGFAIDGLSRSGVLVVLGLPLTGLWGIAEAPVQSAMSEHVEPSEQGELQGAIGAARSVATIVGPPFFSLVFAAVGSREVTLLNGAPWFFAALLLVAATAFAMPPMRRRVAAVG